jgi:hypothetical protein
MLRRRGWLVTRTIALIELAGAGARWLATSPLAWVRPVPWRRRRDGWAWWLRMHRTGLERASSLRARR